jgi:1,2-phenylacetyl-CoA epoxidase PaaB subunit
VAAVEHYRVFARAEYAEPLELKGSVRAAGDRAAADQAVRRFGRDWVELVLLPEREIHWVLRAPLQEGSGDE